MKPGGSSIIIITLICLHFSCNLIAGTYEEQYIGCYRDDEVNHDLEIRTVIDSMTIQKCMNHCASIDRTYAAVQNGQTCYCGDSYGRYGSGSNCTINCPGESAYYCGGLHTNSVYLGLMGSELKCLALLVACQMGLHGNSCHLACNCVNQTSCNVSTAICPNETETGWIVAHCNTTEDCKSNSSYCKGFESCSVEVIGNRSTVSRCRCSKSYNQTYTTHALYNYTAVAEATGSIGVNIGVVFGLMCVLKIVLIICAILYSSRKRIAAGLRPKHLKSMLLASSLLCLVVLASMDWKQKNDKRIKSLLFKDYRPGQKSIQHNSIDCTTTTQFNGSEITSRSCCGECIRLRNLLKNWPDAKPKAFVYYLIESKRVSMLLQSLKSLDSNFNNAHNYPIVIFHENISGIVQNLIRSSSKSQIYFQDVKFEIPDFLPRNFAQLSCHWYIGYRHMCRFHAKLVYDQPIIRGFEYAWRLDDDSKITRPIKYDVFEYMREKNLQYGYVAINQDSPACTVNLWENTRKYINKSSITPTFFKEWKQYEMYYNNFEISRLSLWLSEDYQKFIDYIDRLGGIYYYRWGDAPIKSIAVSLFVQRNETHDFQDIGYQHQIFSRI